MLHPPRNIFKTNATVVACHSMYFTNLDAAKESYSLQVTKKFVTNSYTSALLKSKNVVAGGQIPEWKQWALG